MILTVNSGSSSIRLDVFELAGRDLRSVAAHHERTDRCPPAAILREFLGGLRAQAVSLVAHRVVHGGARLARACLIEQGVEEEIARLSLLAPLHNPHALVWMRACRDVLGDGVPQVAVFDTAFYAAMPAVAASYALPRDLARRHGLRRYGFHGLAHRALWQRWSALRPDLLQGGRVITLQLGAGCSATAIAEGVPQDTSMGFSPLEGLVMATRSGDVDPGLVAYLQRELGWPADRLEQVLNHESGLLGLSGRSGDMRELLTSPEPDAQLAVELYCYRARKYLGAYLAVLGGADGVVFGGGVGENAPAVRERILAPMAWCGIQLDPEANRRAAGREARISAADSAVEVRVIPVDEARVLAREALDAVPLPAPGP